MIKATKFSVGIVQRIDRYRNAFSDCYVSNKTIAFRLSNQNRNQHNSICALLIAGREPPPRPERGFMAAVPMCETEACFNPNHLEWQVIDTHESNVHDYSCNCLGYRVVTPDVPLTTETLDDTIAKLWDEQSCNCVAWHQYRYNLASSSPRIGSYSLNKVLPQPDWSDRSKSICITRNCLNPRHHYWTIRNANAEPRKRKPGEGMERSAMGKTTLGAWGYR